MRWLLDNHVSPEQYQSLQIDLGTKVDKSSLNFTTLNSLLTEMKEIKNKLQNMKAVYMITNTGTIGTEQKQEHILTEINMNRMIISYQFYFQTSNGLEWHDFKNSFNCWSSWLFLCYYKNNWRQKIYYFVYILY